MGWISTNPSWCSRSSAARSVERLRPPAAGAGNDWNDALLADYDALRDALQGQGLVVAPARVPGDGG